MNLCEANEFLAERLGLLFAPSVDEIRQNGEYLVFDGVDTENLNYSYARFKIVIAFNTFKDRASEVFARADELNFKILELSAHQSVRADAFDGMSATMRQGELYLLTLAVKLRISRVKNG